MRPPLYLALLLTLSAAAEDTVDKPLPPEEAAAKMIVPDGFSVSLFAGEPNLVQPVDFCIDDRGRLWVCEALSYPKHTDKPAHDRITIFEDTDNDGRHDKRTVFYDKLNYVTGIEVGFGGAWVMSPPHFFFIPDKDGDDVPDGEPEVVLDGFGNHANSHNLANGFEWGPDGWLYGTHGRTNWSMIGKPGASEEERVRFDGGVWRFDPVSRKWEAFCDGTTNPWGIDWDNRGEAFITNCVNPHLFHAIQSAHYEPWRGRKSSQHAYQRIETIADHLHYAEAHDGNVRENLGTEETLNLGGGHAHCGVLVYPENGPWPEPFRGAVFMNNIHGDRINVDLLERKGSGYTASHGPDLMISRDPWFMGVCLQLAPDGSIYVSDWSDTGECHSTRNTRKSTGRIFKISYGKPELPELDLANRSTEALADLATSENRFVERHSRRLLWERSEGIGAPADEEALSAAAETFKAVMKAPPSSTPKRLRALWALRSIGKADNEFLTDLLDADESIRTWAVRLLCENGTVSPEAMAKFETIAKEDFSSAVRLNLISGAFRLPEEQRWKIVQELAMRTPPKDDPNLSLMLWYLAESLFVERAKYADEIAPFVELARSPDLFLRESVARRIASEPEDVRELSEILAVHSNHAPEQEPIIEGILKGLEGVRDAEKPKGWDTVFRGASEWHDNSVFEKALQLALIFNDSTALDLLRKNAADTSLSAPRRNSSLEALITKRPDNLDSLLLNLIKDPAVQATAIKGLANFDNPKTADAILEIYSDIDAKQDALQTLASRKPWASQLIDAVESGTIPRTDLTAYTARQIVNLNDEKLTQRLTDSWGELKSSSAEKKKQMAAYRKKLTPQSIKNADPSVGRGHFEKLCASCHKLFGEGGVVGPELTGSQRNNLDYLLENLVDPSASVSKDFQMQVIQTTDGRTVSGFAESENETAVTIRSINEKIVIPLKEIKTRQISGVSLMPEGLLTILSTDEIRELVAYLASPVQVERVQ